MITWFDFIYFAVPAVVLWACGAWLAWKDKRTAALSVTAVGIAVFAAYIALMWMSLERPPLRTMGETRLWYSFFMPVVGFVTYMRWRYRWLLSFSTLMATVFVCINIFKPEIHSKTLMPALQSPWFAPHVIIYMFSYAILGAAFLMAVYLLWRGRRQKDVTALFTQHAQLLDDLTSTGICFITFGMLFGALWAKEAWGHYWSWDPKETWAAATWTIYLTYLHARLASPQRHRLALWLLVTGFVCLQMCWWGINYLPDASAVSVHTYNIES